MSVQPLPDGFLHDAVSWAIQFRKTDDTWPSLDDFFAWLRSYQIARPNFQVAATPNQIRQQLVTHVWPS